MNLISYNFFVYFNYLVFLAIAGGGWLISPESTNLNVFLSVAGVVGLGALLFSQGKSLPPLNFIPTRITQLIVFLDVVVVSFSHYFFEVDNSNLILLLLIAPAVSLLTLIFVNTDADTEEK
jgi:hypothetical protein